MLSNVSQTLNLSNTFIFLRTLAFVTRCMLNNTNTASSLKRFQLSYKLQVSLVDYVADNFRVVFETSLEHFRYFCNNFHALCDWVPSGGETSNINDLKCTIWHETQS